MVLRGHGDKKELSVSGTSLTIQPSGYNQIWTAFCNVSIDFDVPGTPSLPPVSRTATIVSESSRPGDSTVLKRIVEITDLNGTLDAARFFESVGACWCAQVAPVRLKWPMFVPRYLRRHARWWLEGSDGYSRSSHHGTQGPRPDSAGGGRLGHHFMQCEHQFQFARQAQSTSSEFDGDLVGCDVRQSDRVQLEGHPRV